jgi:hypothetical protein
LKKMNLLNCKMNCTIEKMNLLNCKINCKIVKCIVKLSNGLYKNQKMNWRNMRKQRFGSQPGCPDQANFRRLGHCLPTFSNQT